MKKLNFGFLILVFSLSQFAFSQQKIKITVTDNKTKEFLYGANIQWLHSAIGATTNEYGIAYIDKPDSLPDYIVITYVGYQTDTFLVSNLTDVNIQIGPEIQLGEVKIKGKRQTNFISSINPIKTEKIEAGELKKAACCNLSESFQTNASADVNYSDAVTGAKEIRLLGLSGIYVQNLLEGIPVMRGVTTTFGLDHIPAPWMKSIAVSKGVPSV